MSRPTHFLCLPLHSHAPLREQVGKLQDVLRAAETEGFHESLLIAPNRLHLTIGVLKLQRADRKPLLTDVPPITEALEALQSCRASILDALEGQPLSVTLQGLDSFSSQRNACHVLYAVPLLDERLKKVCDIVFNHFKSCKLLADHRPYKLHCTIVNTSHRKSGGSNKRRPKRMPFDASCLFALPEAESSFGTYEVDSVSLCRMGSYDENGEYVVEGSISLLPGDSPEIEAQLDTSDTP